MHVCRNKVHSWGRINRVTFDPTKEHVSIIHPIYGEGDPFKFLGCMIDCKFLMNQAIDKILSQMRPKRQAILRTKPHYCVKELINQFKTHVWGLMECQSGGIFHASTTLLNKIDGTHRRFLRHIGVSEAAAFLEHNFASPFLRRNIAILGALHKRVLGKSHPVMEQLLPFWSDRFGSNRPDKHSKQLYGSFLEEQAQYQLYQRSIFGMCCVYNNLSQNVVDASSVSQFQSLLTDIARARCEAGHANWMFTFDLRGRS